jgi:hypothetical protein
VVFRAGCTTRATPPGCAHAAGGMLRLYEPSKRTPGPAPGSCWPIGSSQTRLSGCVWRRPLIGCSRK